MIWWMDGSFLTADSVTLELICSSRHASAAHYRSMATRGDRGHSVNAGVYTGSAAAHNSCLSHRSHHISKLGVYTGRKRHGTTKYNRTHYNQWCHLHCLRRGVTRHNKSRTNSKLMPRSIYDVLTQSSNDYQLSLCRIRHRHGVQSVM